MTRRSTLIFPFCRYSPRLEGLSSSGGADRTRDASIEFCFNRSETGFWPASMTSPPWPLFERCLSGIESKEYTLLAEGPMPPACRKGGNRQPFEDSA